MIDINDLHNQQVDITHEWWFRDNYFKSFKVSYLDYNFSELLDTNLSALKFCNIVYEFTFEQKQYYLEISSQGASLTDKMPEEYLLVILAA